MRDRMTVMQCSASRAIPAFALGVSLIFATAAHAEIDLGPEHAADGLRQLRSRCGWFSRCPVSAEALDDLKRAIGGSPQAQYKFAKRLAHGDGVLSDENGALGWYITAAQQGEVDAAFEVNRQRRDGTEIKGDEGRIVAALRPKADTGNADAMVALAEMYFLGRGVARDAAEGMRLQRRAAEMNSGRGELALIDRLEEGAPGLAPDFAEARRWLERAARRGNVSAMRDLGYYLIHGEHQLLHGEPNRFNKDPVEGYRWLLRAASLENHDAQINLGQLFSDPQSSGGEDWVAQDLAQADMWYRLAARGGYPANSRIEAQMTSAQIEEARKLVVDWRPRPLAEVLAMTIDPPPAPPPQNGQRSWGSRVASS